MSVTIIQQRLEQYERITPLDEENAIKEITQEVVLMALSRAGFSRVAEFHGGTALRILYGLQRFSEDLDFALLKPDAGFIWSRYFDAISNELEIYGYDAELQDRSRADQAVKKAFLKDNSIGKILTINYPNAFHHMRKIRIKLEIDVNPPLGSQSEIKYLDFPLPFAIRAQTLSSSFSGKIHALLCRTYVKGRDWYDFIWYVSVKTSVNYILLESALNQVGPYSDKKLNVDKQWLVTALKHKIQLMDWRAVAEDVKRFLKPHEQKSLEIWGKEFFLSQLEKLQQTLD